MKASLALCLFALLATAVVAQGPGDFFDVIVIDPFDVSSDTLIVVIGTTPGNQATTFTTGPDMLGGERDLRLASVSGNAGSVFSAGVASGDFSCSAPNGADGEVLLQYDGADGTIALDTSGLLGEPNNNFRIQGGFAFRVQMETDISTVVTFNVYSPSGTCSVTVTVPGGDELFDFVIEYDEFTQGCDFSNVGAFELDVNLANNVDIIIRQIATYAPFSEEYCICPPCPEFSCVMIIEADDNGMFYYVTSDFDDDDTFSNTNSFTPGSPGTVSFTPGSPGTVSFTPDSPDSPNSSRSPRSTRNFSPSSSSSSGDDCSSATNVAFSTLLLIATVIYALL